MSSKCHLSSTDRTVQVRQLSVEWVERGGDLEWRLKNGEDLARRAETVPGEFSGGFVRRWRVYTYTVWLKEQKGRCGTPYMSPRSMCGWLFNFFSACWQVYSFLDKMSFYNELYKHKPQDVISHEDGTLWRRQTPKLLYPLGKIKRPWFSNTLFFFFFF